jgi:protein O-mannosyl-transferase
MAGKQKKRSLQGTPRQAAHRHRSAGLLHSRAAHFVLLAALSFAIYANALRGEFVYDDSVQIVRNENVRSLENLPRAFTTPLWSFADTNNTWNNRYYRPMQTVIFAVVYKFAGLSPFAYHLVSLLLHIACSILVYLLCIELGWAVTASLLASSLFAVHPVHTEAVSWIAGVTEVACAFFYFAALLALLRSLRSKKSVWVAVGMLCFLIALCSKEMAVTFPVVALIVLRMRWTELQLNPRKAAVALIPYVLVLGAYGLARIAIVGANLPATFAEHAGLWDWLTLGVWMFGRYLRYAFFPYPLTALPMTPLYFQDRVVSTLVYALLLTATIGLLAFSRRVNRDGLFWILMFSVMLAPVFYFKGITGGFIFAERYLYIPTFPAVALAALFILRLPPRASVVLTLAVIAACSAAVVVRNPDWRNDEVFFRRSAEANPANVYAWMGLGGVTMNQGNYSLAQNAFEMAERQLNDSRFIQLPDTPYRVQLGFGTLAARRNMSEEAKVRLRKAIELNPSGSNAYTILAGVLMNLDRNNAAAIPFLEKAIALDPVDDQARDSMGVALYNIGQFGEAAEYFREALRINPQSELAQQHLQRVMQRL